MRFLFIINVANSILTNFKVISKAKVKNFIKLKDIDDGLKRSSECECLRKCLLTQVIMKKHELLY